MPDSEGRPSFDFIETISLGVMTASPAQVTAPSYIYVLTYISTWASTRDALLSSENRDAIKEILRRLERLESSLRRLLAINAELSSTQLPEFRFDPTTDTISIRMGEATRSLKLNRADPNVPIRPVQSTAIAAYRAGAPISDESSRSSELKAELEGLLEQYYYNAHRVLKLVQSLPTCRNFKSKEITIVRNKLVEHSDHGDIYSFGLGTHGPLIRPMARPGRAWNDAGLIPNTQAFVTALIALFAK
jgi:hypothetical protein